MGILIDAGDWMVDILEEHFEELQFLWLQRQAAISSPRYDLLRLGRVEARIAAHTDGLVVAESEAVPIVEPGLGASIAEALTSAHVLLQMRTADVSRLVIAAFREAEGEALAGLRLGLSFSPADFVSDPLREFVESADPPIAAAAAEALAHHFTLRLSSNQLLGFVRHADPGVRQSGWRLAAYCGLAVPTDRYDAALGDDDAEARRSALRAAAWTAFPGLHEYCRRLAAAPSADSIEALTIFAAIASPEEYQLLAGVATNPAAGPDRFRVVGSFAHPYFIDLLIKEMENPEPAAAVSAGAAFFKMTGRDVESNKRVKVSPDGKPPADDFEAEFQDEVFLPDPELARKHWQELAPTLARSPRICRGMDVSQPLSREQFAALDMESRYEYCLRMRLFSGWQGTPLVLERYPQRF